MLRYPIQTLSFLTVLSHIHMSFPLRSQRHCVRIAVQSVFSYSRDFGLCFLSGYMVRYFCFEVTWKNSSAQLCNKVNMQLNSCFLSFYFQELLFFKLNFIFQLFKAWIQFQHQISQTGSILKSLAFCYGLSFLLWSVLCVLLPFLE